MYLGALHLTLALLAIITVPAVLYLLSEALGFQRTFLFFLLAKRSCKPSFFQSLGEWRLGQSFET